MEQCKECGAELAFLKTLARHILYVHKIKYVEYTQKHGISHTKKCHCGREFVNRRVPQGDSDGGPRRKYCSPICNQHATSWSRVYGISPDEYWRMFREQGGKCAVCLKDQRDEKRQLAVDHEHVDGWELLPSQERGKYVRGLLCINCNKNRLAAVDLGLARRILSYLEEYHARR